MEENPIELYCNKCGYQAFLNQGERTIKRFPRETRIDILRAVQRSDGKPIFPCPNCNLQMEII